SAPTPALRSFPTRRSSDLIETAELGKRLRCLGLSVHLPVACSEHGVKEGVVREAQEAALDQLDRVGVASRLVVCHRDVEDLSRRSEEHTSELQSPYDLVCR